MKIDFDTMADALYIKLEEGTVYKTIERDGYLLDIDKAGRPLGVEVLNADHAVNSPCQQGSQ